MTTYETKDSGHHQEYTSGMRRDSQDGKPRFDLIRTKRQPYEEQMIYRYAMLLARGAEKYSARNWEEGDSEEELDRAKASLLRHTEQLVAGETDEDHAAAVWFNTQAIEYFRWRIAQRELEESAQGFGDIAADAAERLRANVAAEQAELDRRIVHGPRMSGSSITGAARGAGGVNSLRNAVQTGLDRDQRPR